MVAHQGPRQYRADTPSRFCHSGALDTQKRTESRIQQRPLVPEVRRNSKKNRGGPESRCRTTAAISVRPYDGDEREGRSNLRTTQRVLKKSYPHRKRHAGSGAMLQMVVLLPDMDRWYLKLMQKG